MAEPEWEDPALDDDGEEALDVGALLREAFDREKGELPPLFLETVLLPEGVEEKISRHEWKATEERVLRRFFAGIGQDYDVWRRERRREWRRKVCRIMLLMGGLVGLVLGAQAGWPALPGWSPAPATPAVTPRVTCYRTIAEMQPYFAVGLPAGPPAGYEVAGVVLETGYPAGPRATISYQRQAPGPASAVLTLHVRPTADDFTDLLPAGTPETIEIAGRPAHWLAGAGGGGAAFWEKGPWRFVLTSPGLSRQGIVDAAGQMIAEP